LFGFYLTGRFYVVYNHYDSYNLPHLIRAELEAALAAGHIEEWKRQVANLKIIREHDAKTPRPTAEEILALERFCGNAQYANDWYWLLYGCQGSVNRVLQSGYLLNCVEEDGTPCWQEVAVIVNFDSSTLDIYQGSELSRYEEFSALEHRPDQP
jgi:hypothetical protein